MLFLEGREAEARKTLMRCISVNGRVKNEVMCALQAAGVEHVLASFEADAQLAFMSRHNQIQYVISEDSDMLVFGCERVRRAIN
jgi:exonuclease-1